jgi:hypothetical protein
MNWKVLYTIEKLLECRCLKWACIVHLDILITTYGQKKDRELNCQFDSRPLKVGNWTNLLSCRWCATCRWKNLDASYNFASDLISIGGLLAKFWRPKVTGTPTWVILGLPLGSHGTRSHLDVGPMGSHRVYYKGEGAGFPQVRAMMSFECLCCLWFVLAPKVLQLCTNHLVLVLYRSVWVVETCQFFLVQSWSFNMPLYPSKVLQAKERASILYFFVVFCLGLTFESLKKFGAPQ